MTMMVGFGCLGLFLLFYYLNNRNKISSQSTMLKHDSDKQPNNFNTMLNFGVILIIIASLIFATSTWSFINSGIKMAILGAETVLFLVLGLVLKLVFKADNTANALSFISAVLVGATFYEAGLVKMFGDAFSVSGNYGNLFIAVTFLIVFIAFLIRKLTLKTSGYFSLLVFSFLALFFALIQFTNDVVFSYAMLSLLLLMVNLFSEKLFKGKLTEFKVFNILMQSFLSLVFIYSCLYFFLGWHTSFLGRITIVSMLATLSINAVYSVRFKGPLLNVLAIIYEGLLTLWFALLSRSLMVSSYALLISGIILFIIYYVNKNKPVSVTALITSYLSGALSIVLISFDKTYCLTAPLIAIVYLFLSVVSNLKDKCLKLCNGLIQPVFLALFGVSVLIQPAIIKAVSLKDVLLLLNVLLLLALLVNHLLKTNVKNGYFIILLASLTLEVLVCFNNMAYVLITLLINLLLLIYSSLNKDKTCNKLPVVTGLLLVFNVIVGFRTISLIGALTAFTLIIVFSCFTKDKKRRCLYASLGYFPLISMLGDLLPVRYALTQDLKYLLIIPFTLIFTRSLVNDKKITGILVFELVLFSLVGLTLINDLFCVIFLVTLTLISFYGFKNDDKSSSVYFNYIVLITPIMFFKVGSGRYAAIYLLLITMLTLINQVLYQLRLGKRSTFFEVIHAFISLTLLICLINSLNFGYFTSFVIATIFLIINYLIYETNVLKKLNLAFGVYPLIIITNLINNYQVNSIVSLFIWSLPLVIFTRYIIKMKDDAATVTESIVLTVMFLTCIFTVDLWAAITIGIISFFFIMIGMLLNYKSFLYVGYVSLGMILVIQTVNLWARLPWWSYLLIIGIILIAVSFFRETRHK